MVFNFGMAFSTLGVIAIFFTIVMVCIWVEETWDIPLYVSLGIVMVVFIFILSGLAG
jgi:hypothetical protein